MAREAWLFVTVGKGGVRLVGMFLKQSYVRQIEGTSYPFGWVGRKFEVVVPPSGAPERPGSKSVRVGVLFKGAYVK